VKTWIRGGRVVDPTQGIDGPADVLIVDGVVARVASVGEPLSEEECHGAEVVDASGLVVAPGFIDIHVHLREPGQEYKETVRSGTLAAAAGGFTAVACMANTAPPNDNRSVTEHILTEARRHGFARVYPIGAVSKGLRGQELAEMGDMVEAGAVAFSDDGHPVSDPELMRRALEYSQHFDAPIVQHAQDMALTAGGVMHEGEVSARLGLPGIPGLAEDVMVARDLLLLEETGGRYHVAHLSTARSLDLVRRAKAKGLVATCEVTPHHFVLTDRAVEELGMSTDTKMNPPLRAEADRAAMFEGLRDGSIEVIATDHAPHHADEKCQQFHLAPFGIVGLETSVSICLDRLVHSGALSLGRLIELMSVGPARVFSLPGGSLAPGSPGDVTLLDLEREVVVDRDRFRSKGRNTPFSGWRLRGAPAGTLIAGARVRLPGA
jgi:dihydroorotase